MILSKRRNGLKKIIPPREITVKRGFVYRRSRANITHCSLLKSRSVLQNADRDLPPAERHSLPLKQAPTSDVDSHKGLNGVLPLSSHLAQLSNPDLAHTNESPMWKAAEPWRQHFRA